MQSSLPKLDANSLVITPSALTAGVKTEFKVSIVMIDEDGTEKWKCYKCMSEDEDDDDDDDSSE